MRYETSKLARVCTAAACILCVVIFERAASRGLAPAFAQDAVGSLTVFVNPDPKDRSNALDERPTMVSVLQDGKVIMQSEIGVGHAYQIGRLASGQYDIRCEGDGMVSVIRRGVFVTAQHTTEVRPIMRPGQGVCECRYTK